MLAAAIVTILVLIIILLSSSDSDTVERSSYMLGTIVKFKATGKNAEKAIDEAIDRLSEIDDKMSVFKDYSEISKININSGYNFQSVSRDTHFVIKKSLEYSELLEGTFDPTIRPLVHLWGIGTDSNNIPNENEIEKTLKLVNYKDIIINENELSIKLNNKNQALDVGGIAKGYAADEVKSIFKKNKIKRAIIDLGGNVFVIGKKKNGTPWNVGIQNPLAPRGEYVGYVKVQDKSIVTSGNYERYFVKYGKKYHHIIDPKTGYPSESEIISATIISDNSIDGDGLSTGIYIMGIDKAINLIESLDGIDGILITQDKEIYTTSGIKEDFILTNSEYITCQK